MARAIADNPDNYNRLNRGGPLAGNSLRAGEKDRHSKMSRARFCPGVALENSAQRVRMFSCALREGGK